MSNLIERGIEEDWQRNAIKRFNFPAKWKPNPLELELMCFWWGTKFGRFFHLKRLVDFLFTKEGNPEVLDPVTWNNWLEQFLRVACDGDPSMDFEGPPTYLGVTGPASSGKTFGASLYGFMCWYACPHRTKAVIASTSIASAKNRIWADVVKLANSIPNELRYFDVLTSNPAMVKLKTGNNKASIELIAGDDSQQEASGKVLGIKNDFFLLLVDESTEVSHAIYAAKDNLKMNPRFQMIFLGNAASHDDPHGKICEPMDGWQSINVDTEMWRTTLPKGMALHFDGLKSPNMAVPEGQPVPFPRLITREKIGEAAQQEGGTETAGYQRFVRGFWSKTGTSDQIYTSNDIEINGGKEPPIWLDAPKRLMGHDPAFASKGDRPMVVIGDLGITPDKVPILAFVKAVIIAIDDKEKTRRSFVMAEKVLEIARANNVEVENIGVDATGTGISYPDVIDELSEKHCWRISFGGAPSELLLPSDAIISSDSEIKGIDLFSNHVSEIWYVGRIYLQKGQFRGISSELSSEMCKRLFSRTKGKKITVETKDDMRARGVRSPDIADAFFIMLALARERLGFSAYTGPVEVRIKKKSFKEWVRQQKLIIPKLQGMRSGWSHQDLQRP